jgi:hypothetical protein
MNHLLDEKVRVCWHEIGHFVAACYNKQYYDGNGTTAISLTRFGDEYKGAHQLQTPPGHVENAPIERPFTQIASLAYGCIFQSIQQDKLFIECFDLKNGCKGKDDFMDISRVAINFRIDGHAIYDRIEAYYERIKDNEEFKELFAADISDLVQSKDDHLQIDIEEVRKRVAEFLPKHALFYRELVEELQEIFKPYMPE